VNKKLVLVLTIIFVISFAVFALAVQDFKVILDPIGDQEYSSLPQTYDVTGTVTGDENTEINWIKLYIDGNLEDTISDKEIGADGYDFTLEWDIQDEGTFDVKVMAEINDNGIITRQDTESDVEITLTSDGENGDQATGSNPAAPAVANKILKELGVKHNYGGGNYISDVAREMGPGTEFQGVEKTNEDYEAEISSYLEDHDAWDEDGKIQNKKPGNGKGNAYGLNKEKGSNKNK